MDQEHYEDADYEGYEHGEEGEEIEIEAIGVDVSSEPIELYKVFKIANLVSGSQTTLISPGPDIDFYVDSEFRIFA